MFSQRNNPYCELLQNCLTSIKQIFELYNVDFRKGIKLVLINLPKIIIYETNIRLGFGNSINWLGNYR